MRVPLCVLRAHLFSDPDSSRYALGGVRFERDGEFVLAIATDGRRLVAFRWRDADAEVPGGSIPASTIRLALEAVDDGGQAREQFAVVTDEAIEVETWRGQKYILPLTPIRGEFPRWRAILPALDEYVSVSLDAELLRDCLSVVDGVGDGQGVVVSVHKDGISPAVVSLAGRGVEATAILAVLLPTCDRDGPRVANPVPAATAAAQG